MSGPALKLWWDEFQKTRQRIHKSNFFFLIPLEINNKLTEKHTVTQSEFLPIINAERGYVDTIIYQLQATIHYINYYNPHITILRLPLTMLTTKMYCPNTTIFRLLSTTVHLNATLYYNNETIYKLPPSCCHLLATFNQFPGHHIAPDSTIYQRPDSIKNNTISATSTYHHSQATILHQNVAIYRTPFTI